MAIRDWLHIETIYEELLAWGDIAFSEHEWDTAVYWYELAAKITPDEPDIWVSLGMSYEYEERWQEAITAYYQALDLGLRNSVVYSEGLVYYRIGRILQWNILPRKTDVVLDAYQHALADGRFSSLSERANIHYNLGVMYWWQRSNIKPEKYITNFETAVYLNPDHVWANLLLGRAYYEEGEWARAQKYIQHSIDLMPKNAQAYLYLGELLAEMGKTEQAVIAYQRAIALDPQFTEAQEHLDELAKK